MEYELTQYTILDDDYDDDDDAGGGGGLAGNFLKFLAPDSYILVEV